MKRFLLVAALLLVLVLLVACSQDTVPPAPQPEAAQVECPECQACADAPVCPEVQACPEPEVCAEPVVAVVPFEEQWANSPHNDITAEAFNHWNEDDPAQIPRAAPSATAPVDTLISWAQMAAKPVSSMHRIRSAAR